MDSVRKEAHGVQKPMMVRKKATVMDQLPEEIREKLEALRRGK